MKINDGGPAFPMITQFDDRGIGAITDGMSLRDWFAGQALAGILACPKLVESPAGKSATANAYAYADAMLAERERRPAGAV